MPEDSVSAVNLSSRLAEFMLRGLALLPFSWLQWAGRAFGAANYRLNTRAAMVTKVNLQLCFPDLDETARNDLARRSLQHTGMTMMEMAAVWMQGVSRNVARITQVTGVEVLEAAEDRGQGVIVLLPHLGNWELFNAYYADRATMTALYQPPRKALFADFVEKVRNVSGNRVVPTTRGGLMQLYRTLQQGGVVTILPDQVPVAGTYSPFFGIETLTDDLIPRLVRRTGASVVCASVRRLGKAAGFELVFEAADDGIGDGDRARALRAVNDTVERCVRAAPEQYQWEYKRFRERPKGQPKVYRFNKPPGPDMYHE